MRRETLRRSLVAAAGIAAVAALAAGVIQQQADSPKADTSASSAHPNPGANRCREQADPCACANQAANHALDRGLPSRAQAALDGLSETCNGNIEFKGLRAEAMADAGLVSDASKAASGILEQNPKHRAARRAMARNSIAHRDLARAQSLLERLLSEQPGDLRARFGMALVNAGLNRYNAARQGFLKVLRAQKEHVEARYQLVLLTAKEGANDEARHHLNSLRAIAPAGDKRLEAAEAMLRAAGKGAAPAPTTVRRSAAAVSSQPNPAATTAPR